jgi:DNA replication initiation complex subunit (GINS family)
MALCVFLVNYQNDSYHAQENKIVFCGIHVTCDNYKYSPGLSFFMAEVKVSYETLFDMLRREKQREELQELSLTFLSDVADYLLEKEEILKHPFSKEHEHVKAQLVNTKKILRELVDRRENKIIRLAQDKARGSTIVSIALLPEEQIFFSETARLIREQHKHVLEALFDGTLTKATSRINIPGDTKDLRGDAKTNVHENNGRLTLASNSGSNLSLKQVKFLQTLPKFAGKNLEIFGPYKEGETAILPAEIADILIKKGRAQFIDETPPKSF